MSTNTKVITGIIVAVVVIGGIWWWIASSYTATAPVAVNPPVQPPVTATTTVTTTTPPQPSNGISATDNSNAALQADLSNVDTQMNGFSSDNASVTQGMNDQQGQQSQF